MKPMLAVNIKAEQVSFPVYASVKIDGVRGIVIDGKLFGRSLKAVPNLHTSALFSRPELTGYDGELVVGQPAASDVCRVTGSGTGSVAGTPDVKFYVFDNYSIGGAFSERFATLQNLPGVIVIEQKLITNVAELLAFEESTLAAGYEGLVLRDPKGTYKFGRSTEREQGFMKLKRFTDSECEVLEVIEELANNNVAVKNELGHTSRGTSKENMVGKGTAGAMRVRDIVTGVEFRISGWGFEDSKKFWSARVACVGKIVKYKFFAVGVKDLPRFPTFLSFRENWDMS